MNVCERHYRFNNSASGKAIIATLNVTAKKIVSSKETLSLNDQTITAKNYRTTENKLGQHYELSEPYIQLGTFNKTNARLVQPSKPVKSVKKLISLPLIKLSEIFKRTHL